MTFWHGFIFGVAAMFGAAGLLIQASDMRWRDLSPDVFGSYRTYYLVSVRS